MHRMGGNDMTAQEVLQLRTLRREAARLCRLINDTPETDPGRQKLLEGQLFGTFGEASYAKPPVWCAFGASTHIGARFFCNYGCIFQDRMGIRIGDRVMLGPSVLLLADTAPITVGSHVWIGGKATVCGGVTVGSGSVIGAGSVVREDIPANVLAAGNPCRVIRPITEEDRRLWTARLEEYRAACDDPIV